MKLIYKISVVNFEEHNEKSKGQVGPWFKCQARLARSTKYLLLSSGAKHLWIWLLCEAAQNTSRVALLNPRDVSREIHVKPENVPDALSELVDHEWIQILSGPRIEESRVEKNRIEEIQKTPARNTKSRPLITPSEPKGKIIFSPSSDEKVGVAFSNAPLVFDFEALYRIYPRKEGKAAGMKNAALQITSAQDCIDLEKAIGHYAALMASRQTETKFMKQWASFIGTTKTGTPWREFIERPADLDKPRGRGISPEFQRPSDRNFEDQFTFGGPNDPGATHD